MPTDNAAAWDRHAAWYQATAAWATDVATYGADMPTEADLKLLGNLNGKRVLELGCGGAQCSIAFAKQGAHAIGVDFSAEQLAFARRLIDREGVKVELHQRDLADLAFIRAATIDAAFSAYAFGYVEDLDRVFRQVHRVLKPGAPLAFSVPHPAYDMIDDEADPPLLIRRSYFDRTPIDYEWHGVPFTDYRRTIGDLYASLLRANFGVDALLEPEPVEASGGRSPFWHDAYRMVPRTLIVRAHKVGN